MHLEKLELQGFKSFINKTTLSFPQPRGGEKRGITAIVGPNGSGKSNVADAIRWVMGEQSLKVLRCKKSEDVIFSGTEKLARIGLAEVSLHLNNDDRQAPLDYSQIVITRRLYRSGESEYLINRKKVRLQDITLLLAQASAGQKTYSILGQGMVDAILSASPLERKEYLDEAAGTRPLQLKKEESLLKLRHAEENLRQGEALIQEIAPRLRSLTRQVRKLERREGIETKLKNLQYKYFGSLKYHTALNRQQEEEVIEKISLERSKAEFELKKMEENFSSMEKSISAGERFEALHFQHQQLWEAKSKVRESVMEAKTALANISKIAPSTKELNRTSLLLIYREMEAAVEYLLALVNKTNDEQILGLRIVGERFRKYMGSLKKEIIGEEKADTPKQTTLESLLSKLLDSEQELEEKLNKIKEEIKEFHKLEEEKNKSVFELERKVRATREKVDEIVSRENEHKVSLAKLTAAEEALLEIIREEIGGENIQDVTTMFSEPEKENMKREIDQLKHQLAQIGTIDEETKEEYETTKDRYGFLSTQAEDLTKGIKDLRKVIHDLDQTIERQFNEAFVKISKEFERFFKVLFNGGNAKLVKLSLPIGPSAARQGEEGELKEEAIEARPKDRVGIDIQATPPGKRLKSINMLSGGERALTSLALICAIMANNPSPFVVLDEVDASLDEANSQRFAEIIDQLSHRTQFVVITHNRATMHQSNLLYGVTMGDDGASKILSLKLEDVKKEQ